MTACEDAPESPKPQVNEQKPILTAGDIEMVKAGVLLSEDQLNLNTYDNPDNCTITVLQMTRQENLPEGAEIRLELQVSPTADFSKYGVVELNRGTTDDTYNTFFADAYAWNDVQLQTFGNTLKPTLNYYRVPIYVNLENTDYRYMSPDYYALEGQLTTVRMSPNYVIEENYYACGAYIGANTPATGELMYHSDLDVYDDTMFSYIFEVSETQAENGYTIYIAPQTQHNASGSYAECYGLDPEKDGYLKLGGEPITITVDGPYKLEFDAYTLKYTISACPKSLYAISTSWMKYEEVSQLGAVNDGSYSNYTFYDGMAGLDGSWGLAGQPNYRPVLFFNNPDVNVRTSDNGTVTGGLKQSDGNTPLSVGNAIPLPGNRGLYYVTANLQSMEYTYYKCTTIGVVGSMNNWGNKNEDGSVTPDNALTSSRNPSYYMVWKGSITLQEGDEWKIRANNEWNVDFGGVTSEFLTDGSNVELVKGGENFIATEAGTYDITVYFRRTLDTATGEMTPYYMTLTPANPN